MACLAVVIGCGGGASAVIADAGDARVALEAAASSGTTTDQWAGVKARYGLLVAIAGKGETDSRTIEWMDSFEGQAATAAELSRPHFAMADLAGNIYIADKEAHGIRKVTPGGVISTVAGISDRGAVDDAPGPARERALSDPNGLYVLPDGTLYVLDTGNGRVRKVATDGRMTTLFEVPDGITIGRGLWVAPDESEVFLCSGGIVKRWTRAGGVEDWATGFSDLGNIVRDRRGALLVTDRLAGKVFAVTKAPGQPAQKVIIAGNGDAGQGIDGARATEMALMGVRAVWPAHPDDGDGFFVGTHEGCQVWFIDGAGIAHLFLDGSRNAHAGDGQPFDSPGRKVSELRSITLDSRGNVITVDDDRGFVRMVRRK
jgi:hypothetical protein